jgi:magnesium-transporting ATPase (P-type)
MIRERWFDYILKLVIISITLVISVIPEALTLAVIYCLSEYASLSIFESGNIVFRKLKSLENMGRVNCLCLEKQSTFTDVEKQKVEEFKMTGFNLRLGDKIEI